MGFSTDAALAQKLDAEDELAAFRERFVIADPETIYLDGNSLGRLPKRTAAHLREAVERQWGERLIRAWNEGWMKAPHALGDKIARLIGAQAGEVVVSDSTSVNLFKLAAAALHARPRRAKIVSDELNFPSDLYIFQGLVELLGKHHRLERVASRDGIGIAAEDLAAAIDASTALLSLTHVAFKSAFMYDMAAVTELAHQAGALTLWDLSHSVGAVPLELNAWDVDLAVGCSYKYLNGGPGAPAFLYVRGDLQDELLQPIWGWFAAKSPFDFELDFSPAGGISRFKVSSPPILSSLAMEPGLDLLLEAGMERLRAKSMRQSEYLIHLAGEWLYALGFELGSPKDPARRGSHVSLRHPEGYRINRALIEPEQAAIRVIPDFRTPDNIRLGIAPLYTSYSDIRRAMARMREIVEMGEYERFPEERLGVT